MKGQPREPRQAPRHYESGVEETEATTNLNHGGPMTPDEHSVAWREVMDEISKRIKHPIEGFSVTIAMDGGHTVLFGGDYSHNPRIRRVLSDHGKRVAREIAKLEKRGGNVTMVQGKERHQ